MRKLLLLFVLMVMTSFSNGKEFEKKVTEIVKAPSGTRVSKNMIFLFDCSTSMGRSDRFKTAMSEVKMILGAPIDDGSFSLMGFQAEAHELKIWPGIKEEHDPNPSPPGWAKLPSAIALKSANKFLNQVICGGWTDIGLVISKAFELNANKEKLSIILFTDGNNTFPKYHGKNAAEVVKSIKKLQKTRTDRGKDEIRVFVFGLGVEQNVVLLSAIAKAGNGGYLTVDKICSKCRSNKKDVPEIQRLHRSEHTF